MKNDQKWLWSYKNDTNDQDDTKMAGKWLRSYKNDTNDQNDTKMVDKLLKNDDKWINIDCK